MRIKTIEEGFEQLLENNKGQDWDDLTFRQTMVNSFGYFANNTISALNLAHEIDLRRISGLENRLEKRSIKFKFKADDFPDVD